MASVQATSFAKVATWFPDQHIIPVRDARQRLIALTKELIGRHKAALAAKAEQDGNPGTVRLPATHLAARLLCRI